MSKNLPILYTLPKWKLTKGSGAKIRYYVPELNKWISNRYLNHELSKLGLTSQDYYDRWFLNITTKSQRPKCPICNDYRKFDKISHGYEVTCSKSECSKLNFSSSLKLSFTDNRLEKLSAAQRRRYQNYEERVKISMGVKRFINNNPEIILNSINNSRKSHRTKEYRDKMSRIMKVVMNSEPIKDNIRKKSLLKWKNPTNKMIEANRVKRIGIRSKLYNPYESKFIYLDSKWERIFYFRLDNDPSVIKIEREPMYILYYNPIFNDIRKYYPDFRVTTSYCTYLLEIKPKSLLNDEVVQSKYKYSLKYCNKNKIKYLFITENEIFNKEFRLK